MLQSWLVWGQAEFCRTIILASDSGNPHVLLMMWALSAQTNTAGGAQGFIRGWHKHLGARGIVNSGSVTATKHLLGQDIIQMWGNFPTYTSLWELTPSFAHKQVSLFDGWGEECLCCGSQCMEKTWTCKCDTASVQMQQQVGVSPALHREDSFDLEIIRIKNDFICLGCLSPWECKKPRRLLLEQQIDVNKLRRAHGGENWAAEREWFPESHENHLWPQWASVCWDPAVFHMLLKKPIQCFVLKMC